MSSYIEEYSKLDWALMFQRTGAFPLDRTDLFDSYEDAVQYALGGSDTRGLSGTSYVGQVITVYENDAVTLYLIEADRTLKEVGTAPVGDDTTIEVVDGIIQLKGAATAEVGAQLQIGEGGILKWVVPSTETVEGLQTTVATIQTDLDAVEQSVTDLSANVYTKDESYSKTETDEAITTAAEEAKQEAINTILGEGVNADFDTLKEVADWIQSDTTSSAELITRVTNVETKLDTVEEGAQVNTIETVDATQFGLDETKNLTLLDIAMSKVTGLSDALDGKVDKVEGSRLMTTSEAEKLEKLVLGEDGSVEVSGTIAAGNVEGLDEWITNRAGTLDGLSENNFDDTLLNKLENIAEGAQVNAIDGVSDEFVISADGKVLSVNAIDQSKITGLAEALAGKVNVVEGKDLSSNDFTDDLLTKLNAIADGAEVNYIKSVSEEFTVSAEGALSVNEVNVNKLVQTDGEFLILNGGASA